MDIDVRNAYSVILNIFQQKIEKRLPLTAEEKTLVLTAKSWPSTTENLKWLLKCFLPKDLA